MLYMRVIFRYKHKLDFLIELIVASEGLPNEMVENCL